MLCEHCGQVERVENAPCPSCKFQPYAEASSDELAREPTPEEIAAFEICPTPDALALAICNRIEQTACRDHYMQAPFRILEPSAGNGSFIRAARQVWPASEITAVEIRDQCRDALRGAGANLVDICSLEVFQQEDYFADLIANVDLVIGNPPFSVAEPHIRLLLGALRPGAVLAFLLRTGFYESHTRIPFWNEYPEDSFAPVVPRPSFKLNYKGKKGTDSQSYGLFVWTAGKSIPADDGDGHYTSPRRSPHLIWRDPSPRGRKKRGEVKISSSPEPKPTPEPEVFDLE